MRRPSKQILVEHEDGRWYPAGLLDQYRSRDGTWRVVVTDTTTPGSTYMMAMPADLCRPLSELENDQSDNAQARREQADGEHDPAGKLVSIRRRSGLTVRDGRPFASMPARAHASQRHPWFLYVDSWPCDSWGLSSGRRAARLARSAVLGVVGANADRPAAARLVQRALACGPVLHPVKPARNASRWQRRAAKGRFSGGGNWCRFRGASAAGGHGRAPSRSRARMRGPLTIRRKRFNGIARPLRQPDRQDQERDAGPERERL
jgi:hypothetical protein